MQNAAFTGGVSHALAESGVKLVIDDFGIGCCPPAIATSEIMRRIKGRSSSKLFEECPHLKKNIGGGIFWARRYFCATVGQMTEEMIKQYLEHHFEPRPNDDFKMEPE